MRNIFTFLVLISILSLSSIFLLVGGEVPPLTLQVPYEPPIMITYDLHADPFPQEGTLDQRRNAYCQWRDNAQWLLDFLEPYGGNVTFLSVGEFMEFVLEDEANAIPLMRRLYENGGSLGTHSHTEIYAGPHNWPSLGYNATEEQARQNWDDAIRFVNAVVAKVIGSNDTAAIASVNNIRGGHLPNNRADFYKFMIQYGFPIQEGGAGEPWYQYFGHYIFNPFRPAIESPWMENLSTPFVYVPSGPVIGKVGVHAGVYQDFSLPNAKKMFLVLYLNWRYHEGSLDSYRVWTFGWASHNHDIFPNSQTRHDVEEFVKWLNDTFVSRRSASGNVIAKWAGRKEVYDAYLEWENTHPNQSSFNYPTNVKDYNYYPYLKPAQQILERAYYISEITAFNGQGVYAHHLVSTENGLPIYVLWKDDGATTIDLSSEFNGMVKVTSSVSGNVNIVDPHAIEVGGKAIIVEEAVKPTPIEWFANGKMEKWNVSNPRLFFSINNPNVAQALGVSGYGVEIEGTQPHSGIYQDFEALVGVTYNVSFYHKGGSGTIDFLPNGMPPPTKIIIVNNDPSWTFYTETWTATHRNVRIVLTDNVDSQKSYFDNVSFTTPGFSEGNGYDLVLSGDMEWWGRDGGGLPAEAWHTIGTVNVSQATGYSGFYSAKLESSAPDSGIYTNMAITKEKNYTLSVVHKGGAGYLQILTSVEGPPIVSMRLDEDAIWTRYSRRWYATKDSIRLLILDDNDGVASYFDDVSFVMDQSGNVQYEPSINVNFIIHVEPMPGPAGLKTSTYYDWRSTILWLKDIFEEYGHKITLQSNGEYMEHVLYFGHEAEINQFITDGHEVATHNHNVYRHAAFDWRPAPKNDYAMTNRSWADTKYYVDAVVGAANDTTICAAVNRTFQRPLMEYHGYTVDGSSAADGRERVSDGYIGHRPWHPFRPTNSTVSGQDLLEDFTATFVYLDYYPQINSEFGHGSYSRLIDFQRYFLHIYKAWLTKQAASEALGEDKVWVWGWLTHAGSGATNAQTKEKIEIMLYWLNENFIGKQTPRGNLIAQPATEKEVYEEFLVWENGHPGQSSFSYYLPVTGEVPYVQFTLSNLYTVNLYVNGTLEYGNHLTVKFYSYSGEYQGETAVWNGSTPAYVTLTTNVSHPLNWTIENTTLVLTDEAGNVFRSVASFLVRQSHLFDRIVEIDSRWPFAPPTEQIQLFLEIVDIDMQWPYAPP